VIRLLYNCLYPIAFLFLLPGYLSRMLRRGNYRHKFGQRFGIYSRRVKAKLRHGNAIWVHAVSVGEVLIARKFIEEMQRRSPETRIVLSTTTSTGFQLAGKLRSETLEVIYTPIDFFFTARAAVRLIKPCALVLVEAEVWPNIVSEAKRFGASTILINARMSPRSYRRFHKLRFFAGRIFNLLDKICLQAEEDVPIWTSLGVNGSKLEVTGSIKLDGPERTEAERDFRPVLDQLGVAPESPILIGGSTHQGEERILLEALAALRSEFPNLFLILVPRHFERAPEIIPDLDTSGLVWERRSVPRLSAEEKASVLLVDTTGELRDWYHLSTVAFIGKSLRGKGGQNPAEAIAAGSPVLFGPHMANFALLTSQLLSARGAARVKDTGELVTTVGEFLRNPEKREAFISNGRKVLARHQGATARTALLVKSLGSMP